MRVPSITRDLRIVFVSFESHLESNRPNTTQAVTQLTAKFNPTAFCICDEREWCTDYGTLNWVLVYFNSVIKRVKQCCCALILLPKSTLNANLTTTNRFFANDDRQRGRFENFESDHQYESNLESDVRFEIESNHEASQVPMYNDNMVNPFLPKLCPKVTHPLLIWVSATFDGKLWPDG